MQLKRERGPAETHPAGRRTPGANALWGFSFHTMNTHKFSFLLALLLAGLSLVSERASARVKGDLISPSKRHLQRKSTGHASASPARRSRRAHQAQRQAHQPRWKQAHLQSQRVGEIQQALAQAGYYRGEPNGRWDDRTRDAMRHYQQANGFGTTGLPDAKSLMKLGLGPHPLPDDLVSSSAASASLGAAPRAGAEPEPAPQ